MNDREYLEVIIKGLVGSPDEVKVERSADDMGILLSVSVAKMDMGRVIGKEGQVAKSIRTILNSFGYNAKEKVSVKILEPALSSN